MVDALMSLQASEMAMMVLAGDAGEGGQTAKEELDNEEACQDPT